MKLGFVAMIAAALSLGGCADLPGVIREAAKDPARVHIDITTLYGRVVYDRNNSHPAP